MNLIKQDEINGILGFAFDVSSEEFIKSFSLSDKFYYILFYNFCLDFSSVLIGSIGWKLKISIDNRAF